MGESFPEIEEKKSHIINVIKSEEGKFWKFLTQNKYLDERKIKIDENRLNEFYKNKGYYNVNIIKYD